MYERSVLLPIFGGNKSIMKSFARFRVQHWLTICIIAIVAFFSVGCKSSRTDSGAITNPLAAYTVNNGSNASSDTVIGEGNTITPGSLNGPVISVPEDGSASIDGHDNAPLLDNKHPGWQQSDCLSCHNDTTNNPDHNYNDDSLCYLCHGTNGLPGLTDSTPPVLSSVVVSPTDKSVTVSWRSDEPCTSRFVLKTTEGDKMEFPVSSTYTTTHKKTLSGLQPKTTYYYELICVDKSGNKTTSSSFSSVLSFTTIAAVETPEPTTSSTTTEEEEGGQEGEPSDSYFSNFGTDPLGGKSVRIQYTIKDSNVTGFFYYVYKTLKEANSKEGEVASDDIKPNSNNSLNYSLVVPLNWLEAGKNYYIRVMAVIPGVSSGKWSRAYKFKLEK